jgi:hypothetical protein
MTWGPQRKRTQILPPSGDKHFRRAFLLTSNLRPKKRSGCKAPWDFFPGLEHKEEKSCPVYATSLSEGHTFWLPSISQRTETQSHYHWQTSPTLEMGPFFLYQCV